MLKYNFAFRQLFSFPRTKNNRRNNLFKLRPVNNSNTISRCYCQANMEKNGLEVAQNQPHSIWLYLPTEMWFQIFAWLRATRYIALIGVLSKGFREFMLDYFKSSAQWMNKNMNVAIIGSPAVGKSTMLAQLLLQSRLKNIEHRFSKYVKARPTLAVASHYNTFLNGPQSSNPIVHTPHVKAHNLDTALHKLTFFDTPGCGRRLITAYRICTQANTAILLLQRQKEFDLEWLISCVTAAWTSLTHSHFIIAINYYRSYLTQANWEADQKTLHDRLVKAVPAKLLANIKVIPINALEGFNIYSPHAGIDDSSSWYTGPTLYRALHAIWEKLDYPEERMQKPFSMTVLRTVRVNGIGAVVVGTVNSGCIKPEMKVRVYQSKFQSIQYITVNSIQRHGVNKDEANPSDYIGIAFTNGSISVMSKAGLKLEHIAKYGVIIADPSYPPKRVKSFMAAIAITSSKAGQLREGRQYKAIYQGTHIYIQFKSFVQVLDKDHKDLTRKNIRPGDSCLALCEPTQDLWMYPKTTKNQKKDSRDVILITTQRRITAVGRIDSITFEDA